MSSDRIGRITRADDSAVVDIRQDVRILVDADTYIRERGWYERWVKPAVDRIAALILLILTLPILAVCALAIYRTMGSPVVLRQERVGMGGRVFTVYKLRTMLPDRRTSFQPFKGPEKRISHKRPDDPRITQVGRFLRKWSLDELPQLVNVLRGDMSLVGPRPELVDIVVKYQPWQHRRHSVKPGITGLWQVSERGERMMHQATEVDTDYVDNLSPILDLRILAVTPFAALGRRTGI